MIDMELLREELLKRPETKSVERTDEGLKVVIRSKITIYDEELFNRLANYRPEFAVVRDNIQQIECEQVYSVGQYCSRVCRHTPVDAFCNPFLDMGNLHPIVMQGLRDGNCKTVADMLVLDTSSINVSDVVLMRKLLEYVERHFHS